MELHVQDNIHTYVDTLLRGQDIQRSSRRWFVISRKNKYLCTQSESLKMVISSKNQNKLSLSRQDLICIAIKFWSIYKVIYLKTFDGIRTSCYRQSKLTGRQWVMLPGTDIVLYLQQEVLISLHFLTNKLKTLQSCLPRG